MQTEAHGTQAPVEAHSKELICEENAGRALREAEAVSKQLVDKHSLEAQLAEVALFLLEAPTVLDEVPLQPAILLRGGNEVSQGGLCAHPKELCGAGKVVHRHEEALQSVSS